MGAAVPTSEWVALTQKESRIRKRQASNIPLEVGCIRPASIRTEAIAQTTATIKYSPIATGDRCPRKTLSETTPEINEPATAISGTIRKVHLTREGHAAISR